MLSMNEQHIFPAGCHAAGLYMPNLAGPVIVESVDVLRTIAACVPPGGWLLELGTWTGAGAAWIADQRPDVQIVSVDDFSFCPQNLALWHANQRPNMRLFVGQTSFCMGCLSRSFDAVLVDADHTDPGVTNDLLQSCEVVKARGAILAHDYACDAWPDVRRAVDRFCSTQGWGIAQRVETLVVLRRNPENGHESPA